MQTPRVFLTAEWRWLAMLNWPAPADLLVRHLPRGVELDLWNGSPYVSVVGFLFQDTRLRGWSIPGHRTFPELNLRFYVRRPDDAASGGVCFVREVVPLPAVSWIARAVYNENYVTCPMRHRLALSGPQLVAGNHVEYSWRRRGRWNRVALRAATAGAEAQRPSAEEYFAENYWGYAAQRDGGTLRYRVEHPMWRIAPACDVCWDCDVPAMYGAEWTEVLRGPPESAFLIEGSAVSVYAGEPLPAVGLPVVSV